MTSTRIETNEVSNTVAVNSTKNETAKSFAFDKVLPEASGQEDVFDAVSPMVDHALDGLHSTVFAYGQTGSGKTHTIEGFEYAPDTSGKLRPKLDTSPARHGVLPRVIQAVFDRARDRMANNPHVQFRIKCSFMQLYNEKVSDLLNPSTRNLKEGLKIRWTRHDHFEVENLFVFECDNADQMREMLMMGVKEKVMSAHAMNQQSSRSHCIFTIHVHSWDPNAPECVIKSELSVVDLAGSEKLALLSSNPSAQLLKESIEINTSLLSLGKVITALASNSRNHQHVPYRDSKLTKLLKHALGGNSMTAMIACIAPVDAYVEETTSTLLYAGRARNITTVPKINEDPRTALIRQLREEVASLKAELEYYKQLAGAGGIDTQINKAFSVVGHSGGATTTPQAVPLSGRPHSSDDTTAVRSGPGSDEGDLAEKLLSACKMLKNVVSVNTQLRSAFDKLKAAREESAQREVELNAENLALRERIEMLESIALAEDPFTGTMGSVATSKSYGGATSTTGTSPAGTMRPQYGSGVSAPPSHANSDAELLSVYNRGGQTYKSTNSEPTFHSAPQQHVSSSQNSSARPSDRLRDYTAKYRNPAKPTRYEDYYGAAKKASASATNSQAAQAVQELDRLLKSAPKSTQQTVPLSLQSTQAFGALSFGGADNETRDLEERRRRRQEKMQQMQAQHDAMQRGFSNFSGGVFAAGASSAGGALTFPPDPVLPMRLSATNPSSSSPPPLNFSAQPGSSSAKLFNYLSTDEASKMFTPEQQERLRQRGLASQSPSTLASSSGFPAGSSRQGANPSPRGQPTAQSLQQQLEQLQRMHHTGQR